MLRLTPVHAGSFPPSAAARFNPLPSRSLTAYRPLPRGSFAAFPWILFLRLSYRAARFRSLCLRLPNRDSPLSQPPRDSISSLSSLSCLARSTDEQRCTSTRWYDLCKLSGIYRAARISLSAELRGTKSRATGNRCCTSRRLLFVNPSPLGFSRLRTTTFRVDTRRLQRIPSDVFVTD